MYLSNRKFILILVMHFMVATNCQSAAFTNIYNHSRFGDNLVCWLHAQWLSFVYDAPMFYEPFEYSDQLVLHYQQKTITECSAIERVVINADNLYTIDPTQDCLYAVPYFPEFEIDRNNRGPGDTLYFPVNWDNEEFYHLIRSLIQPINTKFLEVNLPANHISVAVHVRKGSQGIDLPLLNEAGRKNSYALYADVAWPLRFPPQHFYTDQIKKISELYYHTPLYIYIFTDHHQPLDILNSFRQELRDYTNITLDCRREGNYHTINVVEDFFAMTQFDCLIRPQSCYSFVAGKISNYKIEIWPTNHHWQGARLFIDEVQLQMGRTFNHEKYLQHISCKSILQNPQFK